MLPPWTQPSDPGLLPLPRSSLAAKVRDALVLLMLFLLIQGSLWTIAVFPLVVLLSDASLFRQVQEEGRENQDIQRAKQTLWPW
jgi:hypothetical protein